jgi:hypothetical protein
LCARIAQLTRALEMRALAIALCGAAAATAASSIPLPLGAYPFVDLELLDPSFTSPGLALQHGPVLKDLDHPLIVPEHPWEAGVHFYTAALTVPPGTYPWLPPTQPSFLLYYGCVTADQVIFFSNVSVCVANSTDGVTWTKPLLPFFPFTNNGTQPPVPSNIVFETDVNEFLGSVFLDTAPGVSPSARFKLVFEADPTRYATIATSPDGFQWSGRTRMDPLPSGFADTQLGMTYDANESTYLVYGRKDGPGLPNSTVGCEGGYPSERRVFYSASTASAVEGFADPIEVPDLVLGSPDPYNCFDSYNPGPSFSVPGMGGVSFLFPSAFHHWSINASGAPIPRAAGNDGVMDIRLLVSRDPLTRNFTYVSRDTFLPRGIGAVDPACGLVNATGSERDAGFVFATVGGLLDVDPTSPWLNLLYWGSQTTHAGGGAFLGRYWPGAFSGIFRAKVRREGLVSLSTPAADPTGAGAFRSVPVSLPSPPSTGGGGGAGAQLVLRLNANVATAGNVTVALLDPATGSPLPGFSREDAVPVHGNGLRQLVAWTAGADLSALVGRSGGVVLDVLLAHTHLYAMVLAYE